MRSAADVQISADSALKKQWRLLTELFRARGPEFKSHVQFSIETPRFVVKTLSDYDELAEVLQLRHRVFYGELAERTLPLGIDLDSFDFECDYVIIKERRTNRVVGTYRIVCSQFTDRYYSSSEFDLSDFLEKYKGTKIEIGRACIDPLFRKGAVIHLLWKGIIEYTQLTQSDYLFGCSSVPYREEIEIARVTALLRKKGILRTSPNVTPIHPFPRLEGDEISGEQISAEVPPLLQFYLRAGGFCLGTPVRDVEFKCADYFTVICLKEVASAYAKKYGLS